MSVIEDALRKSSAQRPRSNFIASGWGSRVASAAAPEVQARHFRAAATDPEVIELVDISIERRLESSEQVLYELAQGGHFKALQMVLYNERSSKWRDLRHIEVQQATTLDVGVVVSVKASVLELLREQGVAALQAPLDVIDVESSEPSD